MPPCAHVCHMPYPSGKAVLLQLEVLDSNRVGVICRAVGRMRDTVGLFLFLVFLPFFCFDFVPFVGDPRECRRVGAHDVQPVCGHSTRTRCGHIVRGENFFLKKKRIARVANPSPPLLQRVSEHTSIPSSQHAWFGLGGAPLAAVAAN